MKLSRRLGLIVASAILGLIVVAGVALTTLRTTMLDERRNELRTVLILATQTVARYQALEQAGTLSHADAQARAIEALAAMRDGKAKYVWARTTDGLGLVLPNMKDTGRIDLGKKLPDGRHDFQRYLDALNGTEFGYAEILVKKPGTDVELPKINGVTKVQGW
ncbi:MAG: methyl-accepting chemotaxis protein, partial [Rhodocyclaceae bacterium]